MPVRRAREQAITIEEQDTIRRGLAALGYPTSVLATIVRGGRTRVEIAAALISLQREQAEVRAWQRSQRARG
jgi:hypothetical protein